MINTDKETSLGCGVPPFWGTTPCDEALVYSGHPFSEDVTLFLERSCLHTNFSSIPSARGGGSPAFHCRPFCSPPHSAAACVCPAFLLSCSSGLWGHCGVHILLEQSSQPSNCWVMGHNVNIWDHNPQAENCYRRVTTGEMRLGSHCGPHRDTVPLPGALPSEPLFLTLRV